MTFSEILPFMNEGFAVSRDEYKESLIIFKQVPASIDDVTNMKSLPQRVKNLFLSLKVGIDYEDQYIVYDFETGVATYCVFDGEDINAKDWKVIPENYNPYVYNG